MVLINLTKKLVHHYRPSTLTRRRLKKANRNISQKFLVLYNGMPRKGVELVRRIFLSSMYLKRSLNKTKARPLVKIFGQYSGRAPYGAIG